MVNYICKTLWSWNRGAKWSVKENKIRWKITLFNYLNWKNKTSIKTEAGDDQPPIVRPSVLPSAPIPSPPLTPPPPPQPPVNEWMTAQVLPACPPLRETTFLEIVTLIDTWLMTAAMPFLGRSNSCQIDLPSPTHGTNQRCSLHQSRRQLWTVSSAAKARF